MISEFPDDSRFNLVRSVILEAGALASAHFANVGALEIEQKLNGQDVVSIADRAVEDLIRSRISDIFPDDGFLGEETGMSDGKSGFVWIVDPIDGTSCFLHGLSNWCVSIALAKGSETHLGLIYDPSADELFVAAKGHGAFLNGTPIRVDLKGSIETGLTGLGANFRIPPASVSNFMHALLEAGGMFFRNGSGALMLAYVACGRLAAYYEPHINAWDCMAGLCLIREAGGWTADYPGGPDLIAGGPVIAAAPQMRDDLLRLIETASATDRNS